jgi:hypothetical protein
MSLMIRPALVISIHQRALIRQSAQPSNPFAQTMDKLAHDCSFGQTHQTEVMFDA